MIDIDADGNGTLEEILERVNGDERLQQYWRCTNVMAVNRLHYSDHGEKHVEIVADHGLSLLRLLADERTPGVVDDYDLSREDAEVVVATAALLHDIGHVVHRTDHEEYSVALAADLLDGLLGDLYSDREMVIMESEILHAIKSHHRDAEPLTLEAGVLRVADSLDMEKGRARAPVDMGDKSIHTISARSIENVAVSPGEETPVRIDVEMNNSSGIFQLDELARSKIEGSGLEDLITLRAEVSGAEKKIVEEYEL